MYRIFFDYETVKYYEYDFYDSGGTAMPFFYEQWFFDPFTGDGNKFPYFIYL